MAKNERVQKLFLICMSSVYLIAFLSLFVQIPGLYGDGGILPVKLALMQDLKSTSDMLTKQPTVLHFFSWCGFNNTQLNLNIITFVGVVVAFASFVSERFRSGWSYALLFVLYQSVVQVGQTFLWFQWDTLLLEAGLLTLLVAPWKLPFVDIEGATKHSRSVAFWLVKWLVFRLMFCSGVVKLNSHCPTWWGLTAMTYHYESQCIPTPLSWYFHHLPLPFHRFSNAMVFIIQISSSILFFSPFQLHKTASFVVQTSLMIVILLTGNYNFFNLLTIFLLFSLLDDQSLLGCWDKKEDGETTKPKGLLCRLSSCFSSLAHLLVLCCLVLVAVFFYGITLSTKPPYIHADIKFSKTEFQDWLQSYLPITIWIAFFSLAATMATALIRSLCADGGIVKKLSNLLSTTVISSIAIIIFATSLVPYTGIHKDTQNRLPKQLFAWYGNVDRYSVINSYGLFRSMTGVGGRPEVVVEGWDGAAWKEYEFLYKPGTLDRVPPFVAPHQPRLDWQMWFAALGSVQHNPWFFNLIYRLLNNQPEVINLMGANPFKDQPPTSIRAQLYHYHYTPYNQNTKNWWKREWVREYMPAVTLKTDYLRNYVKEISLDSGKKGFNQRHDGGLVSIFFNYLHAITPPQYSFEICVAFLLVGVSSLLLDRKMYYNQSA